MSEILSNPNFVMMISSFTMLTLFLVLMVIASTFFIAELCAVGAFFSAKAAQGSIKKVKKKA